MDFLDKRIEDYCLAYTDRESSLLKEINEYTSNNVPQPRMLSGHLQGRFLSMISKIKNPNCILEIGTYTGYSALCMAEGLNKGGKLITIDKDTSLHKKVSDFFRRSNYNNQIIQKLGNAVDILSEIDKINDDALIHGVIVQLPLPDHISVAKVLNRIHPSKDVDGFNPGKGFLRISLVDNKEVIEEAMKRIQIFLQSEIS